MKGFFGYTFKGNELENLNKKIKNKLKLKADINLKLKSDFEEFNHFYNTLANLRK
jgi:hypothetical protein